MSFEVRYTLKDIAYKVNDDDQDIDNGGSAIVDDASYSTGRTQCHYTYTGSSIDIASGATCERISSSLTSYAMMVSASTYLLQLRPGPILLRTLAQVYSAFNHHNVRKFAQILIVTDEETKLKGDTSKCRLCGLLFKIIRCMDAYDASDCPQIQIQDLTKEILDVKEWQDEQTAKKEQAAKPSFVDTLKKVEADRTVKYVF
ncbi:MAG: hypothetical protein Q9168_002985 [Polycauliona sp. 1 TL-2023]